MNDAEKKKLAKAVGPLTSAEKTLGNFKGRASKATKQASDHYKDHKKDQPSWKAVAAALDEMKKSNDAAMKACQKIFNIAHDKSCVQLPLADAKKQIKALMPKLQVIDDAADDFSTSVAAVEKEKDKPIGAIDGVDLAAMRNSYVKDFMEYFNLFKAGVNSL